MSPASTFGKGDTEPAELPHLLPDLLVPAVGVFPDLPNAFDRGVLLREGLYGVDQHLLVFGQCEIHD
jgi:hypothetical protein